MWECRPWPPLQGLAEATRTGSRSNKGLAISPASSRQEAMVDDARAVFSSSPRAFLKRACRLHRSNAQPTSSCRREGEAACEGLAFVRLRGVIRQADRLNSYI